MQQTGLDKDKSVGLLSAAQDLLIERIAEWSAKFCRNLMLRGTPESAAPLREASSEAKEPLVTAEASPDGVATQEHVPSSAEVPESRKAALLRRLTVPKPAGYFRTQQAAQILDVSPRTINRMVSDSRLKKGTTRGTVTAISVKHVYEDTFGKLD
jgi:hypothetical protein